MGFLDKLTGFGTKLSGAVSPFLSLASGVGSLFENKNIDKQIKAQQTENQKNRDYNLMLAQMQNSWSQDQWERENEYNLPINQRKRLEDAGLNPDLMYGNGGIQNIGASSPSMTSGAPSSPTDMSPLGQKKTIGDALRDSLDTEFMRAQIKQVEANTRKTNADAGISETQLNYEDAKQRLGLDISQQTFENLKQTFDNLQRDWELKGYDLERLNYEALSRRIEYLYKEREMEAVIKKLENDAKISENDAKLAIETYFYRFTQIEAAAKQAGFASALPEALEQKFGQDAGTVALILQAVGFLINNAGNIKDVKSLFNKK